MTIRRLLDVLFLVLSAWTMPVLADRPSFAGTWEAKFNGQIFMRLTLQEDDGVTGTLSGGHIETNDAGEIIDASDGGEERPISNTRREGADKLNFDWKGSETETLTFALRLTQNGGAELQFLSLPEGVKLKPIKLSRH